MEGFRNRHIYQQLGQIGSASVHCTVSLCGTGVTRDHEHREPASTQQCIVREQVCLLSPERHLEGVKQVL